ncbi:Nuclear pore complex protein [Dirofilaria immitis]
MVAIDFDNCDSEQKFSEVSLADQLVNIAIIYSTESHRNNLFTILVSMKIFVQLLFLVNLYFLIEGSKSSTLNATIIPLPEMPTNYCGATFVNTDGIRKLCASHSDCYDMREPIYWCRLANNQNWTDKGCHCDPLLSVCIIERITIYGIISKIRNYAYCAPKSSWYCPNLPRE